MTSPTPQANRFRFRVWHKKDEFMVYGDNELDDDEFIVMQSTGLLDKNGKEIFEGDIIRVHHDEVEHNDGSITEARDILGVVTWHENGYVNSDFNKVRAMEVCNNLGYKINGGEREEVIGNVYQDSHLIDNPSIYKTPHLLPKP